MMKNKHARNAIYLAILLLSILLFVLKYQDFSQSHIAEMELFLDELTVLSTHEVYPLMLTEAQKWDPAAEVKSAYQDVVPAVAANNILTVSFVSVNKPSELLFVDYYEERGTMTSETTSFEPIASVMTVNIYEIMDSQEAWARFKTHSQVLSHNKDDFTCASLTLIPDKRAATAHWRLIVGGKCVDKAYTLYNFDAFTGEFKE